MIHDPEERECQNFLVEAAKTCRCCPRCWDVPCGACQQGAVCDETCSCADPGDDFDPSACPGCGGNCQRACA